MSRHTCNCSGAGFVLLAGCDVMLVDDTDSGAAAAAAAAAAVTLLPDVGAMQ